ncbi:MAG: metallophosphoesterase family protein, partial [bacterium]
WTSVKISKETRDFLQACELMHEFENFTIVHSSPVNPAAWDYILSIDDAIENFPHINTRCCFIGHSHVPVIISKSAHEQIQVQRMNNMVLQEESKYIINIGSVGQPRDLDPRAAFAVFDDETFSYELHRVK